jgi:hypothetical protein
MPGERIARLVMILVAVFVVLGLILSAVYAPQAL